MKLTFWGATQTVTGSMHELNVQGKRYLMDCGLYQGHRKEARERNAKLPINASSVEAVMLSHAHIDHSGNLPSLVKNGYSGPIYTTAATTDLCKVMLADSAYIQEKDAEFMAKRLARRRRLGQNGELEVVEPLYTVEDAEATNPLFRSIPFHQLTDIGPGLRYETVDAGHMLGSTCMRLHLEQNGKKRTLGFSGDIGRKNLPIIKDPEPMLPVDYLIMESTYGDRLHQDMGKVEDKLAEAINRVARRGGRIIVPAFAVGRTQQLVLVIHQLIQEQRIAGIPIFVDSPLAVNATEVFRQHESEYDKETSEFVKNGDSPFDFKQLRYLRDVNDSKALNDLRGPMVIISASGMCETGRILHHLRNNIENPRNMVLITGFQAENTLGRRIVDKAPEVNIFGDPVQLRAEVMKLNELSGHADQAEMLAWLRPVVKGLKRVFLVHGESTQSAALAKAIENVHGIPVTIPKRGESFELD